MMQSSHKIFMTDSQIQYRFDSQQSGGLVCDISSNVSFAIANTQIAGYQFQLSDLSGFLVSQILTSSVEISVHTLKLCSNIADITGKLYLNLIHLSQQPIITCNICSQFYPVAYGLCKQDLVYSIHDTNGTLSCYDPFIFDNNQCVCKVGFFINGSICVNIIQNLTALDVKLIENVLLLHQELNGNVSLLSNRMQSNFVTLDSYISQNVSTLNTFIIYTNQSLYSTIKGVNDSMKQITQQISQTAQVIRDDLTQTNQTMLFKTSQLYNDQQSMNSTINNIINMLNNLNGSLQQQINSIKTDISAVNTSLNSFKQSQNQIDATQTTALQGQAQQISQLNTQLSQQYSALTNSINQLRNENNAVNNAQNNNLSNTAANLQYQINLANGRINSIAGSVVQVLTGDNCGTTVLRVCSNGMCGFMKYGFPQNTNCNDQ
ncbi:Growth_factor receptor cysteine-rich domain superfamily [Hexamita inflata]|uniref:Growth factor receptor cysteine-rich domain superfamily n=1 Tax=Hexamita inflata TaxID=28002 RepID=A0AA86RJE6_9EUKA|nr:Growth factor receptor cysteine-rich domain superfamily [Hexamita inflata]CAI9977722.1 Growth factor receptor cysteine-rich domain superfamily [Hexamita inflata]